MTWLTQAIESARELVVVTILAAVLGSQVDGSTVRESDVVDAVEDFRQQLTDDGHGSWLTGVMYSPRVIRWCAGRVAKSTQRMISVDAARSAETKR